MSGENAGGQEVGAIDQLPEKWLEQAEEADDAYFGGIKSKALRQCAADLEEVLSRG